MTYEALYDYILYDFDSNKLNDLKYEEQFSNNKPNVKEHILKLLPNYILFIRDC